MWLQSWHLGGLHSPACGREEWEGASSLEATQVEATQLQLDNQRSRGVLIPCRGDSTSQIVTGYY